MTDHQRAERYLLLLDLDWDATGDDITRSYRELVHVWHPDRFDRPRLKARATRKLQQLNDVKDWLNEHLDELRRTRPQEPADVAAATNPRDRWREWAERNGRDPDHRSYTPQADEGPATPFYRGIIAQTIGIPNFLLLMLFFAAHFGGAVATFTVVVSFGLLVRTFYRWSMAETGSVLLFHAVVFGLALAIRFR